MEQRTEAANMKLEHIAKEVDTAQTPEQVAQAEYNQVSNERMSAYLLREVADGNVPRLYAKPEAIRSAGKQQEALVVLNGTLDKKKIDDLPPDRHNVVFATSAQIKDVDQGQVEAMLGNNTELVVFDNRSEVLTDSMNREVPETEQQIAA